MSYGTPTKWKPSADQERLLGVFQDNGYNISVCDACTEAGVVRQAYYKWHDIPEFSAWWKFSAERHFTLGLTQVQQTMFRAAKGEKVDGGYDRKLFLERFDRDYCPKSRSENTNTTEMTIAGDHDRLVELLGRVALPPADDGGGERPGAAGPAEPGPQ